MDYFIKRISPKKLLFVMQGMLEWESNCDACGLMRAKGVVYFKIAMILIVMVSLHMIVCNAEYRIQRSKRVKQY